MNSNNKIRFFAPLIVLSIAGLVTAMEVTLKKPAEKKAYREQRQQIEILVAEPVRLEVPVTTQGVLEPRTQIRLLPEVGGKIIKVSEKWFNGGYFRKGETLLTIEDHNYVNQLAKAKAALAQAKSALTQEEGLAYVAKQDWQKRNKKTDNEAAKSLALREPQLASAKAQVEAAEADVTSARKNLEKTALKAPFDGLLQKKMADIGQFISPGQLLGEFHAIDIGEVRVPLTSAQQLMLDLPSLTKEQQIPVTLAFDNEGKVESWPGNLVRTEEVLDDLTKVLYGIVQVDDPYGMSHEVASPLRLGSFVKVEIKDQFLDNVFSVPRQALRKGSKLWFVDDQDKLFSRVVKPLSTRTEELYILEGITSGDRIVISGVVDPDEGVQVEVKKPVSEAK